jgi:hypothetical protein
MATVGAEAEACGALGSATVGALAAEAAVDAGGMATVGAAAAARAAPAAGMAGSRTVGEAVGFGGS